MMPRVYPTTVLGEDHCMCVGVCVFAQGKEWMARGMTTPFVNFVHTRVCVRDGDKYQTGEE